MAVASLAVLGLSSWIFGTWHLTSFGASYVPMAPSTAVLMFLLGSAIAWGYRRQGDGKTKFVLRAVAAAATVVSLLVLAEHLLGWPTQLAAMGGAPAETVGGIPLGRMAPLTASTFLLVAAAVFLRSFPATARRSLSPLAGVPATGSLLIGLVVALGYFSETPLQYAGETIPMALLTAVGFMLLGGGLLLWEPARVENGDRPADTATDGRDRGRRRPNWPLLILFAMLVLTISFSGWFYLKKQQAQTSKEVQDYLSAIADLKVAQIAAWHTELLDDGRVYSRAHFVERVVRAFLADPQSATARAEVLDVISLMGADFTPKRIELYDAALQLRLASPSDDHDHDRLVQENLQRALASADAVLADMHHGDRGDINIDLYIPIRSRATGAPPIAVVLVHEDPGEFLFPLVQSWPTPSRTAETLLVRRDGGDVLFLNELRHASGTAMVMRRPLDDARLPAAMGLRGVQGVVEGIDYRGEPVVAALRQVPDLPWVMVAKIDREEIYAPLRKHALETGFIVAVLLLAAAFGVGLLWRQNTMAHLRSEFAAELQAKELAKRVSYLSKYANDIILLVDQDWRILEANDRALEAYGRPLAELQRMTVRDLRTPAAMAAFETQSRHVSTKDGAVFETEHQRRDGTAFPVEVSARAVELQGRRYYQAIVRDISERQRSQEALRASEARARLLADVLEQSSQPFGVGYPDGRWGIVNAALCRLVGYSQEEMQTTSWAHDLTPPEWTALERERLAELHRTGQPVRYEKEYLRKDGSRVPIELLVHLVRGDDGAPLFYYAFIMDLTDRRHAEDERRRIEARLAQAQKMETIGLLAGGVAHDFNNLLTVILGYGESMALDLPPDSQLSVDLAEIIAAGERARDLTSQLLAFSRRQVLDMQILDPNAVVLGIEKLLRRLLGEHIDLRVVTSPACGQVKADPRQLEQVLMNLSVNARDAMPEGGILTIETRPVHLDESYVRSNNDDLRPGPYVALCVSDTGVGMDEATRRQVFEPFFTTKEQGRGTGLGLSTVFGIVKQHGGDIRVYSEVGHGTTFRIYLPQMQSTAVAAAPPAPEAEPRTAGEVLLVVEDEEAVRTLICRILSRLGYTVLEARGGEECLQLAGDAERLDLLLTDVIMPGMNGRQIYERIKTFRPDLKVLFMSGYPENVIASHGILDEGVHFIPKPFTEHELSHAIRRALSE